MIWLVYYSLSPQELHSSINLLQSLDKDSCIKLLKFIQQKLYQNIISSYYPPQTHFVNWAKFVQRRPCKSDKQTILSLTSLLGYNRIFDKMQCTFCHGKLLNQLFTCESHPEVIACRGCRQYDCPRCRAEFRKVELSFCSGCKEDQPTRRMLTTSFGAYCYDCCLKAYKSSSNSKKVILCRHICQLDKYQVYQFLKRFCYRCRKDLTTQKMENLDSGLRQIYPLDINLCQKCSTENPSEQKSTFPTEVNKKTHYQSYESHQSKQVKQTKSNIRPQTVQQTTKTQQKQQSSRIFNQGRPMQSVEEKWKKIQNTEYLRCLSCGHLILSDGLVTEDVVICRLCMKWSNQEENEIALSNSRSAIRNSFGNNSQYETTREDSIMRSSNIQRKNQIRKDQRQQHPYPNGKSTNGHLQKQKTSRHLPQQVRLKKMRSEEEPMLNIPITVKYVDESELVECYKCGIRMEVDSALQDKSKKPICRCCYMTVLEQLKIERQRYAKNGVNSPYQDGGKRNVSPNARSYLQSQRSKSPSISAKYSTPNNRTQELSTQPIIKEQNQDRSNKVKRTESWDESIVVEPVEEHEKRKQMRLRQEQNRIVEELNEEQKQEEEKEEKQSNTKNNDPVFVDDNFENTSSKKVWSEEENQPTIIEQNVEWRARLKKMESWNEEIILEPVIDHIKRKEQQKQQAQTKATNPKNINPPESKIFKQDIKKQDMKKEEARKEQEKIRKMKMEKDQQSRENDMDQKYKEMKERLEKQINNGFTNLTRPSNQDSSKDKLQNSRSTAYSNYSQKQKLSESRSRNADYGSPYYPNHGTYQRNPQSAYTYQQTTPHYPTHTSRVRQYYEPPVDPYRSKERFPQQKPSTRGQNMTGYRTLDRKQIKVCELCRSRYETGFKDFYFQGFNVCFHCFDLNNNLPRR